MEGVLSELHVAAGVENLLARVHGHYKHHATTSGLSAAANDLFGQAASAASLAMYDGEDTQNFIGLIDQQVVCGQFGGAEWLRNGHRVRMVVERRDSVLYAHGIIDEATGLLWIGYSKGTRAELKSNWGMAWRAYFFQLVFFNIAYLILGGGRMSYLEIMFYPVFGGALLALSVALWVNRDLRTLAGPATEIYRLLGFSDPENINLSDYRLALGGDNDYLDQHGLRAPANRVDSSEQVRNVYLYRRAVAQGQLSLAAR